MGFIQKVKLNYHNLTKIQKIIFWVSFFSFLSSFSWYYFSGIDPKINQILYESLLAANKVWFWISYISLGIFIVLNIKYFILLLKKELKKYKEVKHLKFFDFFIISFKYSFIGAYFGMLGYIANLFMLSVFNISPSF